jgi:diguanylate cyclase (GGDEF)-like protein
MLLIWWYGDSLGLLIYTPLLLMLVREREEILRHGILEQITLLVCAAFAVLIFSGYANRIDSDILLTPHLLLPAVLFVAVRYDTRWTAATVAIVSLATAWAQTTGHKPFGNASPHMMVLQTQEFILTLCVIGMGFAILLEEQRSLARGLEGMVHQRTQELEDSNRRLALLSNTDGLTGIANRRHFDEALASEWAHAARSGQTLALAMLDVDLFKSYNDHYGHQAGDDCLRAVAKIMHEAVRRNVDLVARYGGEEFVYLGPGATKESAIEFAESIRRALREAALPHALSPHGVVTVSIGVALLSPARGGSAEMLLKDADVALYEAKAQGRDRVLAAVERME